MGRFFIKGKIDYEDPQKVACEEERIQAELKKIFEVTNLGERNKSSFEIIRTQSTAQTKAYMNKGKNTLTATVSWEGTTEKTDKARLLHYRVRFEGIVVLTDNQYGENELAKFLGIINPEKMMDYSNLEPGTPIPNVKLPYVPKKTT